MNTELIQDLRYKLQKRVRRLNSVEPLRYHATLKRFWHFLNGKDIFRGVLDELRLAYPQYETLAPGRPEEPPVIRIPQEGDVDDTPLEEAAESPIRYEDLLDAETEEKIAAVAYFLLRYCVKSDDPNPIWNTTVALNLGSVGDLREQINAFHSALVEPLYEYIDEHLDDQRAVLALLRRYKRRCEWFRSEEMFRAWQEETKVGEKTLALNLYEYLHDQGIDFSIEPASTSGEVDLIAMQNTSDPLLADAKIFNPERGKGKLYLAKAFNQIYIYTQNYNEPFGYLVIFKTSSDDVRFALTNTDQSTPYVIHNNKTIFFVIIDLYQHETSASKRGRLKIVEIDERYLIDVVQKEAKKEEA